MSLTYLMRVIPIAAIFLASASIAAAQNSKTHATSQPAQSHPAPAPAPPPAPILPQFRPATSAPISSTVMPAPGTSGIAGSTPALRPITPLQSVVAAPQAPPAQQIRPLNSPQPPLTNSFPQRGTSGVAGSTPAIRPVTPPQPVVAAPHVPVVQQSRPQNTPQTVSVGSQIQTGGSYVPNAAPIATAPNQPLPSSAFHNSGMAGSTVPIVGVVPQHVQGRPNFAAGGATSAPLSTFTPQAPSRMPSNTFANGGIANSTPSLPNFGASGQTPSFSGASPNASTNGGGVRGSNSPTGNAITLSSTALSSNAQSLKPSTSYPSSAEILAEGKKAHPEATYTQLRLGDPNGTKYDDTANKIGCLNFIVDTGSGLPHGYGSAANLYNIASGAARDTASPLLASNFTFSRLSPTAKNDIRPGDLILWSPTTASNDGHIARVLQVDPQSGRVQVEQRDYALKGDVVSRWNAQISGQNVD